MSVKVDICNSAMVKLGAGLINDLSDNSKEALLCRTQYDKILKSTLRSGLWSFAMKRAQLTPTSDTLEFGDGNVFQLPADCVRVSHIYDGDPHYKYMIEGRKLIASVNEVNLWYISRDVPTDSYDENFKEAVACALAADLCYALTQSTSLKQGLLQEAKELIDLSRSHSSQEVSPRDFEFNDFLNARHSSHEIYD